MFGQRKKHLTMNCDEKEAQRKWEGRAGVSGEIETQRLGGGGWSS
jgi:hypothetical protein